MIGRRYGWVIIPATVWGVEFFVFGLEKVQIVSPAW
jgi:hypothetical protein